MTSEHLTEQRSGEYELAGRLLPIEDVWNRLDDARLGTPYPEGNGLTIEEYLYWVIDLIQTNPEQEVVEAIAAELSRVREDVARFERPPFQEVSQLLGKAYELIKAVEPTEHIELNEFLEAHPGLIMVVSGETVRPLLDIRQYIGTRNLSSLYVNVNQLTREQKQAIRQYANTYDIQAAIMGADISPGDDNV
jgi:hypothetical protein